MANARSILGEDKCKKLEKYEIDPNYVPFSWGQEYDKKEAVPAETEESNYGSMKGTVDWEDIPDKYRSMFQTMKNKQCFRIQDTMGGYIDFALIKRKSPTY